MGEMVIMTISGGQEQLSIERVAKDLSVPLCAFDAQFGVILVDPKRDIYAIRVDPDQMPEAIRSDFILSGPFSDPKIAPFGPPKREEE